MKLKLFHIGLSAAQTPKNGIQESFEKHFDYKDINVSNYNLNNEIVRISNEFKPDIVFMQYQTDGVVSLESIKKIKENGAYVINFTGDVRHPLQSLYFEVGKEIDLTLFTNYTDVELLRNEGINADFVELGIDPLIFTKYGDAIQTKDVIFLANNYGEYMFPLSKERIDLVAHLKNKMPEKFGVFGIGWANGDGNLNHSQYEEAAHYRGAKIAINLSHFNYDQYSSDRLVRILGSGTMCLCKRFKNCEKRFEDNVHLRYFDTNEQLEELIHFYLSNEDERKRIADNGNNLVHSLYTFENLVVNIKNFYLQNTKQIRTIAYAPLHYGIEYLKEAIQAIHPFVEKIILLYAINPSHGHTSNVPCPESEEQIKSVALAASNKVEWVRGNWGMEAAQRETIYDYANGFDVIIAFDADEVFEQEDIQKNIEFVYKSDKRTFGVDGYVNFWKTFDWEVKDQFRPIRFVNNNNSRESGEGIVYQRIYHFGCCQSDEIMNYKYLIHGHIDEIKSNWLKEKYYAWSVNNQVRFLHPTSNDIWGDAFRFNKNKLPQALKEHKNFGEINYLEQQENLAVIVETRCLENIYEIVENHIKYSKFDCLFFHGTENEYFVKEQLKHLPVSFINLCVNSINESDYNKLLTSSYFWEQIPAEKILIFQHDSRLLRNGIEEFLKDGADWYGAIWAFQDNGGNGGLSLRTKKIMLNIISNLAYDNSIMGNEDIYFSNHIEQFGGKLGSREMCAKFSVETQFGLGSFGYHDIEQWLNEEQCDKIKNQYK